MPFLVVGLVGPRHVEFEGGQISPRGRGNFCMENGVAHLSDASSFDAASSQITLGFLVIVV